MTFGTARWGSGPDVSRAAFDAYVEEGGNFIDTADVYSSGRSEELLGTFIAERKLRGDLVVATKAASPPARVLCVAATAPSICTPPSKAPSCACRPTTSTYIGCMFGTR